MLRRYWSICAFVLLLTADRATKYWAVLSLEASPEIDEKSFSFALYLNRGITFSLLKEYSSLSLAIAATGVIVLGVVCARSARLCAMPGMAWLWAGALGNLVDRVVYGYVIDWIFVFKGYVNLADIWLCIGCFQVLVRLLR
ncbi:lipoprotein signal peptidase [Synergistales bacterium]|nr:lipoprotein signal peptidase [Synergistales bacterium]